jgi:hypothetical protein
MLEKFKVQNTVMFEKFKIENTCLILDLVTDEAVQTKRGVYCVDSFGLSIEEIKILSRIISVSKGDNHYHLTVFNEPSPVTSPAPPPPEPQAEEIVEADQIPFLPSPLLRPSIHVILEFQNSFTSSGPKKKRKKR